MPARVRIRDLTKDQLPKSDTAKFAQGWTLKRLSEKEIKAVADRMAGNQDILVKDEVTEKVKMVKPDVNATGDDSPF